MGMETRAVAETGTGAGIGTGTRTGIRTGLERAMDRRRRARSPRGVVDAVLATGETWAEREKKED